MMHYFAILAVFLYAGFAAADTPTCDGLFTSDFPVGSVNTTGQGPSCGFETIYSISPTTNAFDFITQVDVSMQDNLTINGVLINTRTISAIPYFMQVDPSNYPDINVLSIDIQVFALGACDMHIITTHTCTFSSLNTGFPSACSAAFPPSGIVNIAGYTCSPFTLTWPNAYPILPYYMKVTVTPTSPYNASDPNRYFRLAEFKINTIQIPMTTPLGMFGCEDPMFIDEFTGFSNCSCDTPGIYPTGSTGMMHIADSLTCSGWGAQLESPDGGFVGFTIPLSAFNLTGNTVVFSVAFDLLTDASHLDQILPRAAFSTGCDHYTDSIYPFSTPIRTDLTPPVCGIATFPTSWSIIIIPDTQPTADMQSLVVIIDFDSATPVNPVYVDAITVTLIGDTPGVYMFNAQACASVPHPEIAPEPCECKTGNCSYTVVEGFERRREYPVQPVDAGAFYYAAPFIIDTGGVADYYGGYIPPTKRRRGPAISSNQTNSFLNFIFEEDQYVFPYNYSYPEAYTQGAVIAEENNCGVHVHVLSCSNNIQVWLRPHLEFDITITPYTTDTNQDFIFQCVAIT